MFSKKKKILNDIENNYLDESYILSINKKYLNDRDVALSLLEKNGNYLSYLSKELQDDDELIMIAINNYCRVECLNLNHKNYEKHMKYVLQKRAYDYIYIPEKYKKDVNFNISLIKNNDRVYYFFTNEMKNNFKIIYTYLVSDIENFKILEKNLKENKKLILFLLNNNLDLYQYLSIELQEDKDIILLSLQYNKHIYENISKKLKKQYGTNYVEFIKNLKNPNFITLNQEQESNTHINTSSPYDVIINSLKEKEKENKRLQLKNEELLEENEKLKKLLDLNKIQYIPQKSMMDIKGL